MPSYNFLDTGQKAEHDRTGALDLRNLKAAPVLQVVEGHVVHMGINASSLEGGRFLDNLTLNR